MENSQQNNNEKLQFQPQGIPAEVPSKNVGKVLGILSVILGAISIIGTIFTGPLGIIFGALAISRGEKTLGIIGILLSVVLMLAGLAIGMIYMEDNVPVAGTLPVYPFIFSL